MENPRGGHSEGVARVDLVTSGDTAQDWGGLRTAGPGLTAAVLWTLADRSLEEDGGEDGSPHSPTDLARLSVLEQS